MAGVAKDLDLLFLVRSLGIGGAERQLVLLARGLAQRGFNVGVAVFYSGGALEQQLIDSGVELFCLEKGGRWSVIPFTSRLWQLIRRRRPRIVHGYLPAANLFALSTKCARRQTRVVWGIRDAGVEKGFYDKLTHLTFFLTRHLARYTDAIVVNSETGRRRHADLGYPDDRMHHIPNGIDTEFFKPGSQAVTDRRTALTLPAGVPLVGCIARMDRLKGIDLLLEAFALARAKGWPGELVIVGDGEALTARSLHDLAERLGVSNAVTWRTQVSDLPAFYGAINALCLPSRSEGFSNVLAEAMACGTPCIASDVGDAASILGDTGVLVPAGDIPALAEALQQVLVDREVSRVTDRRARIAREFGTGRLIDRTADLLFAGVPQ